MAHSTLISVAAAVAVATFALALPSSSTARSTGQGETTGGVTHTWTNPANAGGYEGPTIPAYTTIDITCVTQGFGVADGNTNWYLIGSAPWSGNYWASADAFYNNGAVSGSLHGTPYVDPSVPTCGASSPPPPASPVTSPSVSLGQGPAASAGYRYAISLSGFSANSGVSIICYDSVDPEGFYSFTLTTDGNGNASTASWCYSGDGPDHWVTANGISSNHATWGGSSSPPATIPSPDDGGTPSAGTTSTPSTGSGTQCSAPSGAVSSTGSFAYSVLPKRSRSYRNLAYDLGLREAGTDLLPGRFFPVANTLWNHYLGASGSTYTIDINQLFAAQPPLLAVMSYDLRANTGNAIARLQSSLARNQCGSVNASTGWQTYVNKATHSDWYLALRGFGYQVAESVWLGPADGSGSRAVRVRFQGFVADTYNFNLADSTFGRFEQLARDGWAADFKVNGQTGTFSTNGNTGNFGLYGLGIPVP